MVPDLVVTEWVLDGRDAVGDASVCHPCADSYIMGAASSSLDAAYAREKKKLDKYSAAAENEGMRFMTLVAETGGPT